MSNQTDMKMYYVKNGTLYTASHTTIDEPSIIIDGDVVVKAGSYKLLQTYYGIMLTSELISNAILIRFDAQKLPIEDIAYIFRRCIEFTATGFAQQLVEHWGANHFQTWLAEEKKHIPLNVYL